MAYEAVRFPVNIAFGSSFGPGFNTSVIETDGGHEERSSRWTDPRHRYDVSYGIRSLEDMNAVLRFYRAMRGQAIAFRFKDFSDFSSSSDGVSTPTNTDQFIGTGDGSRTQWQLQKTYPAVGSITRNRTITKPVDGSVVVTVDGGTPPTWTINYETGIITASAAPGVGINITAGFEFDVPCRFGQLPEEVLAFTMDGFDAGSLPSIPLVEVRETDLVNGEHPFGGSAEFDMAVTGNISISPATARTIVVETSASGQKIILANPAGLPPGCPYHHILNLGATHAVLIRDHTDSTTLNSLSVSRVAQVGITQDASGTNYWYVF